MADDIDVLARTLWGEARGEGTQGMRAVAFVIMRRAAIGAHYGSTPADVCLKKWQFSCWNNNDPNLPKLKAVGEGDPDFVRAKNIAVQAVGGKLGDDVTKGATHYFDRRMPTCPSWALGKSPCAIIGHHFFYNNIT